MRTIVALKNGGQNNPHLGEYALDYQLPDSPSTLDHAKAVAENVINRGVDIAQTGIDIAGKGIDIAGQGVGIAEKGIEVITSNIPFL